MINKKPSLNIREMVANVKINTLWCGYKIHIEDNHPELQKFFDNFERNNDLLQIFKSAEKYNSINGSSMLFFDIIDNKIKLGVYEPDIRNQTVKIDGITEYVSVGKRVVTRTQNGSHNAIVLECRTHNETQIRPITGGLKNISTLPVDIFQVKVPERVRELTQARTITHNYGVLSAKQFLNKNIIDFETNENTLPDAYPVQHLENTINNQLANLEKEQKINHTRLIGKWSQQDINKVGKQDNILQNLQIYQDSGILFDDSLTKDYYDRFYHKQEIVEADMFINTTGNGAETEIMVGSLDTERFTKGLTSLIEIFFDGCGLDYSLKQDSSGMKTMGEVKAQSKRTYETIKTTSMLRTQQIEEFIERIMVAMKLSPEKYRGLWRFHIVSNILDEEDNDKEMIMKLNQAGMISDRIAIEKINPDLKEEDIDKIVLEKMKKSLQNMEKRDKIDIEGNTSSEKKEVSND